MIRREGLEWGLAVRFGFGGFGLDLVDSIGDASERSMLVIAGVLREEKIDSSCSNKSRQCPELWIRDTSDRSRLVTAEVFMEKGRWKVRCHVSTLKFVVRSRLE